MSNAFRITAFQKYGLAREVRRGTRQQVAKDEVKTPMSAQPWLHANIVRLKKAVLCANCEVISEGLNGHCAACGSEALLGLNELLGGPAGSELNFDLTPMLNERTAQHLSFAA